MILGLIARTTIASKYSGTSAMAEKMSLPLESIVPLEREDGRRQTYAGRCSRSQRSAQRVSEHF